MRNLAPIALLTALACSGTDGTRTSAPAPAGPQPPVAELVPHEVSSPHGTRTDPYYWMRDDTRKSPRVLRHLEAENAYSAALLAPTAKLQQTIYDEIVGRIKQDDSTVPVFDNGFWYYTRFESGKQYGIFARKKTLDGVEQILLDQNEAAKDHKFYRAGGFAVSQDGNLFGYVEDTVGRNQFSLRVVDLRTGKTLPDSASNVQAGIVWANDNKSLFYVEKHPKTLLGYRVRRHVLGADSAADPLVYEEKDTAFYVGLSRTKSDAYIAITLSSTISDEVRLIDANKPESAPAVFLAREKDHKYSLDHISDRFVIRTNYQAKNYRIAAAKSGDRATWRDVLPHRDDAFVHSFDARDKLIAVSERSGGLRKVRVIPASGQSYLIPGAEKASTMSLYKLPDPSSSVVRYGYTSMTTPRSTFELDTATGTSKLLKRQPVLGGFDSANYETEFFTAKAADGADIPVSIVYRKGLVRDGSAPIVEYGYGSYGSTMDPRFRTTIVSLLDRGVVFAVAHVRGGQAKGRDWYDSGRLLNKKNTFTDFIAVRDHLVENKYGSPNKVIAYGGSAGGLLVGAVANMAPAKYRGVLASVPFVDVVTTMLDPSVPLTSNEYDEWGDPRDKTLYDYMLSYSPYDNVAALAYPAMLITTGLWDSQVQYWEPAKWAARLRARGTGGNPILLHVNMDAGHGGKSGRYSRYRETARNYAWMLMTFETPDPR